MEVCQMFDTWNGDFFNCAAYGNCDAACEWMYYNRDLEYWQSHGYLGTEIVEACFAPAKWAWNLQEMPEHPIVYSFYFDPQSV